MTDQLEVLPAVNTLAPLAANPSQTRQQQLAELQAEAKFLEVAFQLADKACGGQLVAAHFRGKPADGAIAIAYGATLGWHWTKSLQDVYVVNGKPSIQSKEMRELLIRAGHEVWEEEVGPERVVLAGRRRGSEIVVRVEWTMDKARTAKLTSNPNYDKFPENMLYARCTTDLAKRLAPDALSGLGIVEELEDLSTSQPVRVRADRADRGIKGLRAAVAANAVEQTEPESAAPETDAAPTEPTPEAPEVHMITSAQSKKLYALLRANNLEDKDAALAWISAALGQTIASTKDLTKAQAITVIDKLDQPTEEQLTTTEGNE
ncbi:hypothetical protein [Mycobacteroides abscessus]|uniref:hypothetical protein n=1 Tax=Mycobacteroides abscessus TaxID=36809 RepID=UPI00092AAEB0|nr:hypothetical protein [Mycobacteroides abscessus]SIM96371.1 Uncharacterised protein [Mycobacteroides abscessus subsp. abscessus]